MPSKLKKAIGAVKDQTSIGIAKVGGVNGAALNLEVTILKATSHDESPLDQRYVSEILHLVASDRSHAASCARAISRRIGKTRSWIVMLKSLMLVLRIFQDGDPFFPREVLHMTRQGGRILNLSGFGDNSNSCPWDFTAYVRMFALYLDDRLDCILKGKLQKRVAFPKRENEQLPSTIVRDMKPSILIDRISYWQRLLDRAIETRPTGCARENGLVRFSLYLIIQESFDLYRDISDGLALLLDGFFHLQYQCCIDAFQICVKTSRQFQELSSYYYFCKSLGIGRRSEYPTVQKISNELMETLREFLKDQASFPSPPQSALPSPPNPRCSSSSPSDHFMSCVNSDAGTSPSNPRLSEKTSEGTSRCTSLEELMFMTDAGTSPSFTFDRDSIQDTERWSARESLYYGNSTHSSPSTTATTDTLPRANNENANFISFDDWSADQQTNPNRDTSHLNKGWVSELGVALNQPRSDPSNTSPVDIFGEASLGTRSLQTNPFLEGEVTPAAPSGISSSTGDLDFFAFQATTTPTFNVRNPNTVFVTTNDPFASSFDGIPDSQLGQGLSNQQRLLYEQQQWLRNQSKIIERYMT